jgi:hypothetical protein
MASTRDAAALFLSAAANVTPGPLTQMASTVTVPSKLLALLATAANVVAPAKVEMLVSIVLALASPPVT